jgi:hypothetical protein
MRSADRPAYRRMRAESCLPGGQLDRLGDDGRSTCVKLHCDLFGWAELRGFASYAVLEDPCVAQLKLHEDDFRGFPRAFWIAWSALR